MALDPWSYAEKTNTEYAHQVALFMWSNAAVRYGVHAADFPSCYTKEHGEAARTLERIHPTAFAERYYDRLPILSRLHAIKNQGHGDEIRGAKSAAEGVKAGVPDMFLPVPRMGNSEYEIIKPFGLYIELKRPRTATQAEGKLSVVQSEWIHYLTSVGYEVKICYGWLEAREAILTYLGY